jgi:hypothetical protein
MQVKIALARSVPFLALALSASPLAATPAAAQAFPPGSYQRSCNQIHWDGQTLVAECRKFDGRYSGTGLPNALHCRGDIGNNNGQLQCNAGGPAPAPAPAPPPGPVPPPAPGYGAPGPGYGAPQGPGPGYPPPGADEHRVHCEELWHREQDLRDRLQTTPWGPEHEDLDRRLHETHDDRERLGCGH